MQVGDPVDVDGFNLDDVTVLKLGSLSLPFAHGGNAAHVLHFTVPANGVTGKLFVQSNNGTFTSATNLGVRPTIDSLSVSNGGAGTPVTLTGNTLNGGTVKFTGLNGTQTVSASAASRTAGRP